jgi:hypothetical protein
MARLTRGLRLSLKDIRNSMKTSWLKVAQAVSIAFVAAAVPACGAGDLDGFDAQAEEFASEEMVEEENIELGTLEQRMQNCTNPDGTNAAMAAFAVAVGKELGRWQATRDFEVFGTSGQSETSLGSQQAIRLTTGTGTDGKPRGKSRCAGGYCRNVQALLDMQYDPLRNKIWIGAESGPNKTLLDPSSLRSRMVAKLQGDQKACDQNPKDNDPRMCPVEIHKLVPAGTASLGGCGMHYKFNVTKDAVGTLLYPKQLKNKLLFADHTNGWVDFVAPGERGLPAGQVAIDPTYGLNEDVTQQAGACTIACTKISSNSLLGQCCQCGGVNKLFARASTTNPNIFACQ